MKKAYSKSSRQGLPGGPNEMFQKVKGIIVSERGQWDFPGMTTLVPTQDGRITMRGVPYPVLGQDETGYTQMMYPEQEYQFPGQNVLELPMAQNGLTVSQIWEQKTGIPWSEAKNKGYTSGSFDDNINLRKQLLSGNFELNQTSQFKPLVTNTSTNVISVNANSFSEAFKQARNQLGANKIFIWNGRKYGTNLAGEDFKPDEQTLSEAGLNNKQTKQRLETENKKLQDPYIGKSTVKLEGDWKDLEEVKTDKKQYEKSSQAERIIRYKNENKDNKNYVIVDKEKGLLHIYKPGQSKPIFTSGIDLGKNIGDDQTVTKVRDTNKDGIITEADKVNNRWVIDWEKGSGTTGAGRYYISNITKNSEEPGYTGYPSLNMMNERQYDQFKKTGKVDQVSTSFHKGYVVDDNNRVSNGCIRCNRTTLNNLVEQLSNSSEVYILPEDRDEQGNLVNEFVYENGKLNFRTKDYKKYLTYKDSKGQTQKGQGLNRTEQTLNYKPITLGYDPNRLSILSNSNHNETVVEDFSEALSDNKQKIMKVAQINGDVYNEIAKMAFGILGAETNWGETFNLGENVVKGIGRMITGKVGGPDYSFKAAVGRTDDDDSVGLTQLKWKWVSAKEREKLKELGITSSEDFLDPQKAAIGTAVILGIIYNEQLKTEDKANLWETLPGKWNNRPNYARRIKFNSAPASIKQYTGDSKKGDLIKQNYKNTKAQNIIKEQIQQDSSKPFVAESTRGSMPIRNINFEQISFPNRKFGGALPKAQSGLQVPIERPDALRVHMNIDPNAKYEEKKKSDVLDLDNALDYLVETRGGTRDLWGRMADTIGYHESWHTMDPLKLQSNDGPGRGIFQFEPPSLITAQNRYRRIADRLSLKTDPEILNAKSAIELSPEQQYALFLINIAESKAPLKDYADNKLSLVDLWLQGHKNVERVGNRESFRTSVQKAKNESIQKGYDSFKKLGGSLPKAQTLGQFNPQLFQPNPLTGRYNWEKPKAKPQLRDFAPKQKAAERSSTNVATKPDPIKAARQINATAAEEYERNRGVIRNAPVRASSYFKPGGYDPMPLAELTGLPSIVRIVQNPESINDFLTGVDQLILGSSPVSGMMGLRREFTPEEIQAMSDYGTVAAMAAPLAKGAVNLGAQGLRQAGRYATTQTPLRNAYKLNPKAIKEAQEKMNTPHWLKGYPKPTSSVDDVGETFYHGSPWKWDKYDPSTVGKAEGASKRGLGLNLFSEDKYFNAPKFANIKSADAPIHLGKGKPLTEIEKTSINPTIYEFKAPKDFKLKNMSSTDFKKGYNQEDLFKEGYDGIRTDGQITVFPESVHKLKMNKQSSIDDFVKSKPNTEWNPWSTTQKTYINKEGRSVFKPTSSVDDVGRGFKSEIDWGKWNKEIPENKALMQNQNINAGRFDHDVTINKDLVWKDRGDGKTIPFNEKTNKSLQEEYTDDLKEYYDSPEFNRIMREEYPDVDIEKYKQATLENLEKEITYNLEKQLPNTGGVYYSKNSNDAVFVSKPNFRQRVNVANQNKNIPEGEGQSYLKNMSATDHELSHQRTNASELLPDYLTRDYLWNNTKQSIKDAPMNEISGEFGHYNYYAKPTEFEVRLRQLKKDLKREGIVDYFQSPVEEHHIQTLLDRYSSLTDEYADLMKQQNKLRKYNPETKRFELSDSNREKYFELQNKIDDIEFSGKGISKANLSSDSEDLLKRWDVKFLSKQAKKIPALIPFIGTGAYIQNKED